MSLNSSSSNHSPGSALPFALHWRRYSLEECQYMLSAHKSIIIIVIIKIILHSTGWVGLFICSGLSQFGKKKIRFSWILGPGQIHGAFLTGSQLLVSACWGSKNYDRDKDFLGLLDHLFMTTHFECFENYVSIKNWGGPICFNPNTQKILLGTSKKHTLVAGPKRFNQN